MFIIVFLSEIRRSVRRYADDDEGKLMLKYEKLRFLETINNLALSPFLDETH